MCWHDLQAKAGAADRRATDAEAEMLLLGRSLRDAEAAVVEWQVGSRAASTNWCCNRCCCVLESMLAGLSCICNAIAMLSIVSSHRRGSQAVHVGTEACTILSAGACAAG